MSPNGSHVPRTLRNILKLFSTRRATTKVSNKIMMLRNAMAVGAGPAGGEEPSEIRPGRNEKMSGAAVARAH